MRSKTSTITSATASRANAWPIAGALVLVSAASFLACLVGCRADEPTTKALPPAAEWQAPSSQNANTTAPPSTANSSAWGSGRMAKSADPHAAMTTPPTGASGNDPHAGMDINGATLGGGDPHAGMNMGTTLGGGDPHAGMNMGTVGGDPHAGVNMGGDDPHAGFPQAGFGTDDPAMAAIQPPNPNRTIDPSRFVKGTIVATEATANLIKPGAIIFIKAVQIEPVTGDVISAPVAVARIDVTKLPLKFHLSEANAMSAGTTFGGTLAISARVDSDGEARSRTSGDVEGTVRATVPSEGLTLTLDTIIK